MPDEPRAGDFTVRVVTCDHCGRVYDVTDREERIEGTFFCSTPCFLAGLDARP